MKRKTYSPEQRTKILEEVSAARASGITRKQAVVNAGISMATYAAWVKQPTVIVHRGGETPTRKYVKKAKAPASQDTYVVLVKLGDLARVLGGLQ